MMSKQKETVFLHWATNFAGSNRKLIAKNGLIFIYLQLKAQFMILMVSNISPKYDFEAPPYTIAAVMSKNAMDRAQ